MNVCCPKCKEEHSEVYYSSALRTVLDCGCGHMIDLAELTGDYEYPKKRIWKQMFFIRHIRYFYCVFIFNQHALRCIEMGLGLFPQERDLLHLQNVWNGKS